MKTHVLTFAKQFMKGHPRQGQLTKFKDKIIDGEKIHTIRSNFNYWRPKIEEVIAGEAYLSLRYWTGKPYRSKQREFGKVFDVQEHTGAIGWQEIEIDKAKVLSIDGKYFYDTEFVALNDGLSETDFLQWFNELPFKGIIIHFTGFRY